MIHSPLSRLLTAALLTLSAACASGPHVPLARDAAPARNTPSGPVEAPSIQEAAEASYSGIEAQPVRLHQGVWEGEPFTPGGASRPRVTLAPDFRLAGDLQGKGARDAVVILTQSSGGSGVFDFVAVLQRHDNDIVNVGTASLGDRVQIRTARIEARQIILDVVQAGPEDALCCPSQLEERRWELRDAGLVEGATRITGKLSLSQLEGAPWLLTRLRRGEKAPGNPPVTLSFSQGRISGSSGCNRYSGEVRPGASFGEIEIGPLAVTQMACQGPAEDLEHRYLAALGKVRKFGFLTGFLVLTYEDQEQAVDALLFSRSPDAAVPAQN